MTRFACIDVAGHVVAESGLPVPDTYGDLFVTLARAGWLDRTLAESLRRAVGFRNVLVNGYLDVEPRQVHDYFQHLEDLSAFARRIMDRLES